MKVFIVLFLLSFLSGCQRPEENFLQGYVEGQYTYLASNLSGRLTHLYAQRGQTVHAGQRLFDLDPQPESSSLIEALANLEAEKAKLKDIATGARSTVLAAIMAQRDQAQADLELSKNNFSRTTELFQKGVVSRANYDEALAKMKSDQQRVNQYQQNLAEAELGERQFRILQQNDVVKAKEASLAEAKWKLGQKTMLAPENGFIFDTYFNEGEQVPANQAVLSLLYPRNIYLVFFIGEPWRSKLAINQEVTFFCDGCPSGYHAIIDFISPQAEFTPPVIFSRESRYKLVYRVQAVLAPAIATKLHPGQPIDVQLSFMKKKQDFWLSWRRLFWKK